MRLFLVATRRLPIPFFLIGCRVVLSDMPGASPYKYRTTEFEMVQIIQNSFFPCQHLLYRFDDGCSAGAVLFIN